MDTSISIAIAGRNPDTVNYENALRSLGADAFTTLDPEQCINCDGLLLPGGGDITPAFFGQHDHGSRILSSFRYWIFLSNGVNPFWVSARVFRSSMFISAAQSASISKMQPHINGTAKTCIIMYIILDAAARISFTNCTEAAHLLIPRTTRL